MRCGVYDCLYVALAEREGCEFLTSDDKVLKNHRINIRLYCFAGVTALKAD
jgi:predicted nucleic acid-binding protein